MKTGDVVTSTKHAEWGPGFLLTVQPHKARAFFLQVGEKALCPELAGLRPGIATAAEESVFAEYGAYVSADTSPAGPPSTA